MSPLFHTLSTSALRRAALAGLALALSACSTDLAGPTALVQSAESRLAPAMLGVDTALVKKTSITANALRRTIPLTAAITRSVLVTFKEGATLLLPEAGLEVKIPAHAIAGDTLTISVTALAGKAVAYEFQPHGAQFRASLKFVQDLANTSWDGGKSGKTLRGGYFREAQQIEPWSGAALLDELLPAKINAGKVGLDLWHFSGYMVSMD